MAQREQPPKSDPVTADPNPPAGAVVTGASVALPAKNPSWFTPRRLLTIFCIINLINYMDRGAIASNGVNGSSKTCKNGTCSGGGGIQGTFNLSNFEDGALSSAFMVGLLVSSPIFATLAKSYNPFRLIGVGLSVWTVAIIGCGCSFSFWFIALSRMFVGVGEASFISLAAPFIDDNAPVEKKAAWLSMFYMCMPTGYAIGYMYGGEVGSHFNWRIAFLGEAVLMLPFVILSFVMKPLDLKGFASASHKLLDVETAIPGAQEVSNGEWGRLSLKEESGNKISTAKAKRAPRISTFSRFIKDMKMLLHEKVFVINVLGYICYNFVIGAYSYWGPKAGKNIYNMKSPDLTFGGVTVVCGVLGTVAGGYALDRINSTLSNAFKLLTVVTFFGASCCFAAFCFKNIYIFLGLFAIGELLVFATQGPVNYICLHCVKPSMRPLSMAMSTVSIHIFGDVPSSPLFGVLQDHTQNWRVSTLILTSIFIPAVIFWFIGIFLHSVDRFNEAEDDAQVTTLDLPKPVQGKETEIIEC